MACVLSAILFNIVLDWIMREVKNSKRGITRSLTGSLEDVDYATDICLLSNIFRDMLNKINRLTQINANKTKFI